MKIFSFCSLLFFAAVFAAVASSPAGRLDFVDDPAFNDLNISLTFAGIRDTDTARISGHLDVSLTMDGEGLPTGLEVTGGRFFFSDTSLEFRLGLFPLGSAQGRDLTGTMQTPLPPAPVEANGDFDVALHEFVIDGGTMEGQALTGGSFTADFEEEPAGGPGSGTGRLTALPDGGGWLVTMDFPVVINQITEANGFEIIVEVDGTLRAAGVLGGNGSPAGFPTWVASLDPPLPSAGLLDKSGPLALPNLLFYATNLHPLSGESPNPSLSFRAESDPAWVVTYRRKRDLPDAELRLIGTSTPGVPDSWLPVSVLGETVTELEGGTDQVESVIEIPPVASAWFIRLEAVSLP